MVCTIMLIRLIITMNELVSQVRAKLQGKDAVGPRLPYWLGMMLGYPI